jgi:hypothetical protein
METFLLTILKRSCIICTSETQFAISEKFLLADGKYGLRNIQADSLVSMLSKNQFEKMFLFFCFWKHTQFTCVQLWLRLQRREWRKGVLHRHEGIKGPFHEFPNVVLWSPGSVLYVHVCDVYCNSVEACSVR